MKNKIVDFFHSEKLRKFGQMIRTNGEAIRYYGILSVLLVVLGVAAHSYRSGGLNNAAAGPSTTNEPAVEAQSILLPPSTPQPAPEPMIWPVEGAILREFCVDQLLWSEELYQWQTHPGIDIAASVGEAVVAAESGIVLEAYEDPLLGNVIVIDHGEGRKMLYASLNTLKLVKIGQSVKKGEVISAAGTATSEGSIGAHVHIEYFVDDVAADFAEVMAFDGSGNVVS